MIAALRVAPESSPGIAARDPRDDLGLGSKEAAKQLLDDLTTRLSDLQERLYAERTRSVLVVLQGLDASGKDGVIRSVFTGVNPLGIRAASFGVPTETELAHDYLWRIHAALPSRGTIGVFNRSHYEDVVAVRMHDLAPEDVWRRRPAHIRAWEAMLVDEGTAIVKVFLNVSRDEQRRRFQERIDDPTKRWKFRRGDLEVRERFDEYVAAWEERHLGDVDGSGALACGAGRSQLGEEHGCRDHRRRRARTPRSEAARAGARPRRAGDRMSPACSHLESIAVTELPGCAARVRGVRQDRRPVGAPAHVPAVRKDRLLRQLAEPARNRALRGDGTPADPVRRAVRGVEVVLRRPDSGLEALD